MLAQTTLTMGNSMKRAFLLCMLLFALGRQGTALADERPLGVYITPKVLYGYVDMNKQKGSSDWSDNYTPGWSQNFSYSFGDDNDNVFGGALAVGYAFDARFGVPVRTELEYSLFSQAEGKGSRTLVWPGVGGDRDRVHLKQKHDIQTVFVNIFYDVKTGTAWTPYVGFGLGLAFINSKGSASYYDDRNSDIYNISSSRKNNTNFAWNIGAGVAWAFTERCSLDLGYRFVGLGKTQTQTARVIIPESGTDQTYINNKGKTDNLYMHQVALGLRYSF